MEYGIYVNDTSGIKYSVAIVHCKQSDFQKYNGLHCVPIGSKYDAGSKGKWLYFLEDPQTVFPYELPANVTRHGFSWCEWEAV